MTTESHVEREIVHLMRRARSSERMRLICGSNPREEDAWTINEVAEVNCPKCLAILEREAVAT